MGQHPVRQPRLIAMELTAWTQLLAFGGHPARRWEPKRLRHRLLTIRHLALSRPARPTPRHEEPGAPERPSGTLSSPVPDTAPDGHRGAVTTGQRHTKKDEASACGYALLP